MNELDILYLFYDKMKSLGAPHHQVTLSIDNEAAETLSKKLGIKVSVAEAQTFANICLANEWLERTTIDPGFNFLSLTEAGLQMVLLSKYT